MSDTLFKQVDYNLGSLMQYIGIGDIGLPDIQRPFVWSNTKVRDLFDSIYRGYPVGYFLFWQTGVEGANPHLIGVDLKQKAPGLLIVDGQQRLTALYAVIRGIPVVRQNYDSENIKIAFSPVDQRFEVVDAAILRDPQFIPDISSIWSKDANIFTIANEYVARLRDAREVDSAEEKAIQDSIMRLRNILSFPFTALELSSAVNEEQVAEVFVRINSTGKPLNQADFILTLMSVFWDEGRAEMERFCSQARKPTTGAASPYNHFISPDPDQLLRASVGLGFKRARLQYVYSILRGKDLETEQFSDERREEQFAVLKKAQTDVLNLNHWHGFFTAVMRAGFRSSRMISSKNTLIFSYVLFLIGARDYHVEHKVLRNAIARWFFMAGLTHRYTSSPETALEADLARLRSVRMTLGLLRFSIESSRIH